MANELDLTIVYEPGEDGWIVASIPEAAGVISQGRTRDEARENVIGALRLMLSPEPRAADDQHEREVASDDRWMTGATWSAISALTTAARLKAATKTNGCGESIAAH